MLWLLLGALTLFLFLGGLRAFERASVTTIKSLVAWIAALGGVSLALLLILMGREGIALGALALFVPLFCLRYGAYRAGSAAKLLLKSGGSAPPPPWRGSGFPPAPAFPPPGLQPGPPDA